MLVLVRLVTRRWWHWQWHVHKLICNHHHHHKRFSVGLTLLIMNSKYELLPTKDTGRSPSPLPLHQEEEEVLEQMHYRLSNQLAPNTRRRPQPPLPAFDSDPRFRQPSPSPYARAALLLLLAVLFWLAFSMRRMAWMDFDWPLIVDPVWIMFCRCVIFQTFFWLISLMITLAARKFNALNFDACDVPGLRFNFKRYHYWFVTDSALIFIQTLVISNLSHVSSPHSELLSF